jgi:glutathione S-transferase
MRRRRKNVLVTIPISHFCEKARWALDRSSVKYSEQAHVQFVHQFAARRAGGGKTVPVFVYDGGVLSESADIVDYADAHMAASRKIYPDDASQAAEIRRLERDFDDRLGPEGRRWMYHVLRRRSDLASRYGTAGVPAFERIMLPVLYPAVYAWIDRHLKITQETADLSINEVRRIFDTVAERLSDGRPYLWGERFTAADLTFSALAAAVVMPPGYGVELPPVEELPAAAATVVQELRAHPAGQHALAMYRNERR